MKSCDRSSLITVTASDVKILPVSNTGQILSDEQISGYDAGSGYQFGLDHEHKQINSELEHHYDKQIKTEVIAF